MLTKGYRDTKTPVGGYATQKILMLSSSSWQTVEVGKRAPIWGISEGSPVAFAVRLDVGYERIRFSDPKITATGQHGR